MLAVVAASGFLGDLLELHGHNLQAALFVTRDDLTDQAALYCIRLHNHQ